MSSSSSRRRRTVYLSGTISDHLRPHLGRDELGVLVQPGTMDLLPDAARARSWGCDNGCFVELKGGTWDRSRFERALERCPRGAGGPLFVVAPDRPGDHRATLERSAPWLERIRALGLPAAFAAQDGIELELEELDWSSFDVLFVGGSDSWKYRRRGTVNAHLSPIVVELLARARARGVPTHVGRINSGAMYRSCDRAGATTCDGNFHQHAGGPDGVARMLAWFEGPEELEL